MTAEEKKMILNEWDQWGASLPLVKRLTGMSDNEVQRAVSSGELAAPVHEQQGVPYWRYGDIARLAPGWA